MEKIDKLILSGGGIKGIAYVGVLKALYKKGILDNIKTFAGTSAGCLIIVLLVIGYTYKDIYNLINNLDFNEITSCNISKLFIDKGMDNGKKFEIMIAEFLAIKNIDKNITFLELYNQTGKEIIFATTNLSKKELCYLSYKTHPDLSIITGLRMTSSIPIMFVPVIYKDELYVDGALVNNYPINLFNDCRDTIIGVCLTSQKNTITNNNINVFEYLCNIYDTVSSGITDLLIHDYKKETNIVLVDIDNTSISNIDINKKKELIETSYNKTIEYLTDRFEK